MAARTMVTAGPNLTEGDAASAVDLGRIQGVAERALRRLTEVRLAQRWDEVFDWIRRLLGRGVQRRKELKIQRQGAGIHIEFVTQDDLGYYRDSRRR